MDLTTITTYLSQYGTWGILLSGVLVLTSDWWLPKVKNLPFLNGKPVEVSTDDQEVRELLALHLIQARGKRNGCPDFQKGLKSVEECWFHEKSEPAT